MFELVKNEFLVLVRSWSEIGFRLESESTYTFTRKILFNTEIVKFLIKLNWMKNGKRKLVEDYLNDNLSNSRVILVPNWAKLAIIE